MRDNQKTKAELLKEVESLRKRMAEHRQMEDALRESEEKWHSLLNNTPDIILIVERDGTISFINHTEPGFTKQEIIGKSAYDFISPEHHEMVRKDLERVFQTGHCARNEISGVGYHGSLSWYQAEIGPIKQDGRIVAASIITRDITEQKKAEEEVKKFKEMTERATFGCGMTDLSGNLTYINESFAKMHGYAPAEVIGKNLKIFHTDAQMKRVVQPMKRLVETGEGLQGEEVWHVHRDGTEFPTLMSSWVLKDSDGNPYLMCGTAVDITDHKRVEDALRESEKRFRGIFENTDVGVYRTTPDGQILMANPALVHMLGYSSFEELSKRKLEEEGFEPQYNRSMFKEKIEREGRIVSSESIWITQGGKKLYVIENARAVRDEAGKILYYEGTVENITKRKQAEEELDMYREKMAHAERLVSLGTLSATLAHTLNQPLTAIRLSIENSVAELEKISCPDTVIEDLNDGLSSVSDVTSKVNILRDIAHKSSKKIISEVNLKSVAERILKLLNESARRAKVTLCLDGMEELPPIFSNEKDLEQLFFALVENAIQAADGKKSRQLIISGDVKDELIELRFTDDCGGIAKKNLDKVFEPFFTTRPVSERTGLGLCIVEHIVSGAGGKVHVESKTGKGSTFFVTLPFNRDRIF